MADPHALDPETLRRMREVIVVAVSNRSQSVREAAAEARGLARGLQPRLPAEVVETELADLLREIGCYEPPVEQPGPDGGTLSPVDPAEIADSLAYAMKFDERGKARRTGVEFMARLAADTLVRHLLASGFVLMRRRPSPLQR